MACPDGTVYKLHGATSDDASPKAADAAALPSAKIDIDLDFCKGCGVCARVCPADCIEMIPEGAKEQA
jgi:Pyruvate/2-oxoacid:ferredoxin oxidoreductase delta subunit